MNIKGIGWPWDGVPSVCLFGTGWNRCVKMSYAILSHVVAYVQVLFCTKLSKRVPVLWIISKREEAKYACDEWGRLLVKKNRSWFWCHFGYVRPNTVHVRAIRWLKMLVGFTEPFEYSQSNASSCGRWQRGVLIGEERDQSGFRLTLPRVLLNLMMMVLLGPNFRREKDIIYAHDMNSQKRSFFQWKKRNFKFINTTYVTVLPSLS